MNLFDVLARNAMLVECLKVDRHNSFVPVAKTLSKTIRSILADIGKPSIAELNKLEMSRLLSDVSRSCWDQLNAWNGEYTDYLSDLFETNMDLQKVLMASYMQADDKEDIDVLSIGNANAYFRRRKERDEFVPFMGWHGLMQKGGYPFAESRLNGTPNPATGQTMADMQQGTLGGIVAAILNRIRRGATNAETDAEITAAVVGSAAPDGSTSELQRAQTNVNVMIDTTMQQSVQSANRIVQSAVSDRYQWISVMDNRTSDICRSLNLRVFEYGKGPLPPAHMRCRSHIMPYISGEPAPDTSFFAWASDQPMVFIGRVFPRSVADTFANRTARAADHPRYAATRPMTLQEYSGSANITLS
jgi:SPP1 gp7 family putative phage head morphogenesis protein